MRLAPWTLALALMVCAAPLAQDKGPSAATTVTAPPTLVEVFTSKYCPNCPAVEKQLKGIADTDPSLLIVFEHVDYWDQGKRKDPFGLPDLTQRQYDYSNSVSRRPGEVFTPMPLLNGKYVASMPMWLNWSGTLAKARKNPGPQPLAVTKTTDGGLKIVLPKDIKPTGTELTLLGVVGADDSAARRVKEIQHTDVTGPTVHVPAALVPKAAELIVLLQKEGPQDLLAVAWLKK